MVEMVDACIRQLKRGKAAGHDQLTVEHLVYAHPILLIHLSLLFNILKPRGTVPHDFCKGIIIPLIKNSDGDKTSSDNYTILKGELTAHTTAISSSRRVCCLISEQYVVIIGE